MIFLKIKFKITIISELIFVTMAPPSQFTMEQQTWIVEQYAKLGRVCDVRRSFRLEYKMSPRNVPSDMSFKNVINRFKSSGSVTPAKHQGCAPFKVTEDNCARVKDRIEQDNSISIRKLGMELGLSITTVLENLEAETAPPPLQG